MSEGYGLDAGLQGMANSLQGASPYTGWYGHAKETEKFAHWLRGYLMGEAPSIEVIRAELERGLGLRCSVPPENQTQCSK